MCVSPGAANRVLAVELEPEAVRLAGFLRGFDDDVADFFFKSCSYAQLGLVVDEQHEDEVSVPSVAIAPAALLESVSDPSLTEDGAR